MRPDFQWAWPGPSTYAKFGWTAEGMPSRGEPERKSRIAAATARLMGNSLVPDAANGRSYAFLHVATAGAACKESLSTAAGLRLVPAEDAEAWMDPATTKAEARYTQRNMDA